MRIEGDWLAAGPTRAVFAMLSGGGHRALAVGGCVRDELLGRPVADIDISTDATPDRVMSLAGAAGLKAVPTGLDHGTVTVVSDGWPHEVTTFRRDVATDGRHATVAFTDDVTADAARRDLTMNALYAEADGRVVDPLGGLPDLRAGRVRFIGDPAARIAEDMLRILRFFRFTAWYGDPSLGVDAPGLAACAAHAGGLDRLSRERVGIEMRRLLGAPVPGPVVASMAAAGVLDRVLPGADPAGLPPFLRAELHADWIARLAALGGDVAGLRLSNADRRALADLRAAADGGAGPFALGADLGAERAVAALALRTARAGELLPPDALDAARAGATAVFPLAAADLMPALSGPALGQGLARARVLWLARGGRVSRDALLDAARG